MPNSSTLLETKLNSVQVYCYELIFHGFRYPLKSKHCHSQLLSVWMKLNSSDTFQMKAAEQYFPLVQFIMLYKVVLTFESEDKIL